MCFVQILGQTAALLYTSLTDWFFITVVESVYRVVRTESLCKADTFIL